MPVTRETYERLALEDDDTQWEYVCGQVREKPGMTHEHNWIARKLEKLLIQRVDLSELDVSHNSARLRVSNDNELIPDVAVIQVAQMPPLRGTMKLEAYAGAVPFVAEVWSPSTGKYDVETKFPEYRLRGDREVWRIHPYERTVTAWRLQPDGSYSESLHTSGRVAIASLPGITIDLDELLRFP